MPETKITLRGNNFDVAILTPSQVAGQGTTLQLVMAHAICLISFPALSSPAAPTPYSELASSSLKSFRDFEGREKHNFSPGSFFKKLAR